MMNARVTDRGWFHHPIQQAETAGMPGIRLLLIALIALSSAATAIAAPPAAKSQRFDRTVAPLLAKRCLGCHSGAKPKGSLDLSRRTTALKGGDGGKVLVPGNAAKSVLWQRIRDNEMPPKKPLPKAERELLKRWIDAGANWGTDPIDPFRFTTDARAGYDWWSLQPVKRPSVPQLQNPGIWQIPGFPVNPIDSFILRKLQHQHLSPSPPADRLTLIRRLKFDLLGLPPTPEEIDAFLNDRAPNAYEKLVDRYLASPQYGERWARHWLDVARFGESQGFERDKLRSNSWRYRDWVVAAFNRDMPYDEFARLQIAGDVLRPANANAVVATGFLVAGPWDEVGQTQQSAAMKAVVRQDELEDYVSTVGQTFLGLTIHCARCHDHKFDPIRQEEYYRLTAALGGARHGERPIGNLPKRRQADVRKAALQSRLESLRKRVAAIGESPVGRVSIPSRTASQQTRIADGLETRPTADRRRDALQFEIAQLKSQLARWGEMKAYAVAPKTPGKAYLLNRGNPAAKVRVVKPGGVASLSAVNANFGLPADADDADRRTKLAAWITDRRNPLFARVIVNRLWHYHFGKGLVDTPNDFGFNGGRPSHPELLDWLAAELVTPVGRVSNPSVPASRSTQNTDGLETRPTETRWSLKHIHRLIVTSATYRQSSRIPNPQSAIPNPQSVDAGNRTLWRMSPRRLEAEAVRDAMLQMAGQLNTEIGGPGFYDFTTFTRNSQFYKMRDPAGFTFDRRSLYRTWVRSGRNRFLDVFDCPDPSTKTPKRAVTMTPVQSLALLNNSFVLRMSDRFAARLRRGAGEDAKRQVEHCWRIAYGRLPDDAELRRTVPFVKRYGLAALCRVVFNSNEFLFAD
jgi:Protein of unknown function (DUF1549)/Protein of unknown function (DUF1553)/Planctomycete cytochrome C